MAIKEMLHERLFNFKHRSLFGMLVPTRLSEPRPAIPKHDVRACKYDLVVDEIDHVHAIINYALIRMKNGQEISVSLRDVASCNSNATGPNPENNVPNLDASPDNHIRSSSDENNTDNDNSQMIP